MGCLRGNISGDLWSLYACLLPLFWHFLYFGDLEEKYIECLRHHLTSRVSSLDVWGQDFILVTSEMPQWMHGHLINKCVCVILRMFHLICYFPVTIPESCVFSLGWSMLSLALSWGFRFLFSTALGMTFRTHNDLIFLAAAEQLIFQRYICFMNWTELSLLLGISLSSCELTIFYYLCYRGCVFGSACLFVSRITEGLLAWFLWNLVQRCSTG